MSPTLGDALTQTGVSTLQPQTTPESKGVSSVIQASGIIRIIFKRP